MPEPMRVLIAEDDFGTAETLADILEGSGYEVELASDGAEAVSRFEAKPCDVVFLDVRMPGMGGLDVFRRLKRLRHVPAVLMTAYAQPEVAAEAEREGMLAVVLKPLPLERVLCFLAALGRGRDDTPGDAHAKQAAAWLRELDAPDPSD